MQSVQIEQGPQSLSLQVFLLLETLNLDTGAGVLAESGAKSSVPRDGFKTVGSSGG